MAVELAVNNCDLSINVSQAASLLRYFSCLNSRNSGAGEMNITSDIWSAIRAHTSIAEEREQWTAEERLEWTTIYQAKLHDLPSLSLGERGTIFDCSKSLAILIGFRRNDLVLHPVSGMFPQLSDFDLIQAGQVDPLLKYLCRCGKLFQAQNRQGETFSSCLSIVSIEYAGFQSLRMIVVPSY